MMLLLGGLLMKKMVRKKIERKKQLIELSTSLRRYELKIRFKEFHIS